MGVPSDTGLIRRYIAEEGQKSYFRFNTHTHTHTKQRNKQQTNQLNKQIPATWRKQGWEYIKQYSQTWLDWDTDNKVPILLVQ